MDKATYHIENSYRSISPTNLFCEIYERILLQQAANILEENKFFEGKNLYAYQKNKNARQALLPLVEQMHEAIANGEYGIVIMADLEGAFDSVWREGVPCTNFTWQGFIIISWLFFPAFSQTAETLLICTRVHG